MTSKKKGVRCSLVLAVFRSMFPVPGAFRAIVPCSRPFSSQCSVVPAACSLVPEFLMKVPCSRLFWGRCSLFPAVFGPMFPVPGNPIPSPVNAHSGCGAMKRTQNGMDRELQLIVIMQQLVGRVFVYCTPFNQGNKRTD